MALTEPRFGLSYGWTYGENGWNTGMDSNLLKLGTMQFPMVISDTTSTPPGSPTSGDLYLVGASATGAWSGQEGKIALYNAGTWVFYAVSAGWEYGISGTTIKKKYVGGVWRVISTNEVLESSSTTKTFALSDLNYEVIRCTAATDAEWEIPANASVAFPIGSKITVYHAATGEVDITLAAGVTLESSPNVRISGYGKAVTLMKVATNTWMAIGSMSEIPV